MGKNGFIKSIKVVSLSLAIASQSLKALFPLKNGRRLRSKFVIYGNYKVDRLRDTLKQLSSVADNLVFGIPTRNKQ